MSNTLKAEIKIATAHEIGARMDDLLDVASAEIQQAAGAQAALLEASKAILKLHTHVDTDLDGELYPLDVGAKIKHYVTRAVTMLEALAQRAGNMQMTANGRKHALQQAVDTVKNFHDAEVKRLAALQPQVVTDTLTAGPRTSNEPPNLTIKERRQAEEAAKVALPTQVVPAKKRGRPAKK